MNTSTNRDETIASRRDHPPQRLVVLPLSFYVMWKNSCSLVGGS